MSREVTGAVISSRSSDRQSVIPVARGPRHPRHAWPRRDDQGLNDLPPAGQPGHGREVTLRRQPTRIVEGRAEGGFTAALELVCRDCGDHPDLDYSEISSRLQQIRGPYLVLAALAALEKHLGLAPDVPGRPSPRGGGTRSSGRGGPGSGDGWPVAR